MMIKRIEPGEGQESVWDYPRPPRIERSDEQIRVILNGVTIAESTNTVRILETSHPPVYYISPDDIETAYFSITSRKTFCEFKGQASYYTITVNDVQLVNSAWYYKNPVPAYALIKNYIALYPGKMDACYINDEKVQAQAGDFYGGWITSKIVGPFKGGAGTRGW